MNNSVYKKKWKYLTNIYNSFFRKKYPVSLTHFITKRCNARCPHCFIDFDKNSGELNLEQIEQIAKTSGKCLRNVGITGGEPFLREDLYEIADIWYKNSTVQSLVIPSNGSMPEKIEDFAKKASKNNLPVSFFFSYDFIGEKHSEYRNIKDLHLKVIDSYNIVKSFKNLNATMQITLSPENVDCAFDTYKYIRDEIKAENINCTLIRGEKADILSADIRKKIAEEYKGIEKQINHDFDTKIIKGYSGNSLTDLVINSKNKIVWKYVLKTFLEQKYISPCFSGSLFGVIQSNGDVTPCELLNEKMGNLADYNYNFMKLWEIRQAMQIRKNIADSKCHCTFECSWLINIFSSLRYYPEIFYNIIRNLYR